LHAAAVANGEATESQRPSVFLRSAQIKRFVNALKVKAPKSASEQIQPLRVIKGGEESGAWGVELLAIRYAAWIKPEFEIDVYEVFRTVVRLGVGAISRLNKIDHIINTERAHPPGSVSANRCGWWLSVAGVQAVQIDCQPSSSLQMSSKVML
ncbi:KilA-N domain-containing protein, partial [Salmonella enterica]|nr:KilA-N domain-containing protein [Salmonella enterica]